VDRQRTEPISTAASTSCCNRRIRAQEAKKPLRDALVIDPRRASTWAALADTLFETGDDDGALAALLLTHAFSGNREKIIAIFEEKAASSERSASLYAQALKKINGEGRSGADAAGQ
jgi:predicted Zn-dependent protease